MLPNSIKGIIVGKSNCGKTQLMLNLLLDPELLDYNKLFVFGQSLHQKEYQIIKKAFESNIPKENIVRLFDNQDEAVEKKLSPHFVLDEVSKDLGNSNCKKEIECHYYEKPEDVLDPKEINSADKNLMVFDDLIDMKKQNKCEAYYLRGRHNNIDCFYLSQNYFKLLEKMQILYASLNKIKKISPIYIKIMYQMIWSLMNLKTFANNVGRNLMIFLS